MSDQVAIYSPPFLHSGSHIACLAIHTGSEVFSWFSSFLVSHTSAGLHAFPLGCQSALAPPCVRLPTTRIGRSRLGLGATERWPRFLRRSISTTPLTPLTVKRSRLRPAVVAALVARWSALLPFAAQLSFAESLLEGRVAAGQSNFGGPCPDWSELLADSACPLPPRSTSRTLTFVLGRVPLPIGGRVCSWPAFGDHRAARARARVRVRAPQRERASTSMRRCWTTAAWRPIWGGVQVAVDTTPFSPVRDRAPDLALRQVRGRKYPELLRSRRCRLLVHALKVGGRWLPEGLASVRLLARAKSRRVRSAARSRCAGVRRMCGGERPARRRQLGEWAGAEPPARLSSRPFVMFHLVAASILPSEKKRKKGCLFSCFVPAGPRSCWRSLREPGANLCGPCAARQKNTSCPGLLSNCLAGATSLSRTRHLDSLLLGSSHEKARISY